jgi:hypothetical protein
MIFSLAGEVVVPTHFIIKNKSVRKMRIYKRQRSTILKSLILSIKINFTYLFVPSCSAKPKWKNAGISFAGNIDDTDSICDWLWSNIATTPKPVEIDYQNKIKLIEPAIVT